MRFLLLLLLVAAAPLSAEVYKWTDESGRVHFSDKPSERHRAQKLDVRVNTYEHVSYERVEVAPDIAVDEPGHVTMYATSWCPYCKKARDYFRANDIPYTEYDIENDATAKRRYDRLGATGVPVILVGDKRMNGFSVAGFQRIYP